MNALSFYYVSVALCAFCHARLMFKNVIHLHCLHTCTHVELLTCTLLYWYIHVSSSLVVVNFLYFIISMVHSLVVRVSSDILCHNGIHFCLSLQCHILLTLIQLSRHSLCACILCTWIVWRHFLPIVRIINLLLFSFDVAISSYTYMCNTITLIKIFKHVLMVVINDASNWS